MKNLLETTEFMYNRLLPLLTPCEEFYVKIILNETLILLCKLLITQTDSLNIDFDYVEYYDLSTTPTHSHDEVENLKRRLFIRKETNKSINLFVQ